jgi:hypothetical protein
MLESAKAHARRAVSLASVTAQLLDRDRGALGHPDLSDAMKRGSGEAPCRCLWRRTRQVCLIYQALAWCD